MNPLPHSLLCGTSALLCLLAAARAGVTMTALTSFGGGDGWRAPLEILPGDAAGSNDGTNYTYFGTGSLERGIAFNPGTDHLLLVSRFTPAAPVVRLLDALSGADVGELSQGAGIITGGFFPMNMVGVGADNAIYVANLQTNVSSGVYKVYKWAAETDAAPTVFFGGTIADYTGGTPRHGDSFDVFGEGDTTTVVAGASGVTGYSVITAPGGVQNVQVINSFAPAGVVAGDFRLGITFGKDGVNQIYGRQTPGTAAKRTTYAATAAGTYDGTLPLTVASETAMDVATIGGRPLLATLNVNTAGTGSPTVRVYDVIDPASPSLAASSSTATGLLGPVRDANNVVIVNNNYNANATGSVKWGKITTTPTETTATLYALVTNQGIQAFTVTVTAEITAPAILASPPDRSIYERGVATFTVSASGTPPLNYQWLKDGQPLTPAETSSTLRLRPLTAVQAGSYTCKVTNAAPGFAESTPAVLTVVPSVNTTALTKVWEILPGSRAYMTEGDTQRGVDYNPTNGHVYLATRTPGASIQVLDGPTGEEVTSLNMTGVTGGTFPLMFTCVGTDNVIWACNLSSTADGSGFKIYQWPDEGAETVPGVLYDGNPVGSRIGDSMDLRGGGAATEIVCGARNTNQFVVFTVTDLGFVEAHAITVTDAANGAFGLGIAFGQGNTVWGKNGGAGLTLASYDLATGTGAVLAEFPTSVVPGAGGAIAVDNATGLLAAIHTGDSDNVRLYNLPVPLPDPVPATLELLDQEFYWTDNTNGNSTGALAFGGDKLFALNTNNGLIAYTVVKPPPAAAPPVITDVTQTAGSVVFKLKGTVGKTYSIEKSTQLDPAASWSPDGTVTQVAVEETVTRTIPAATPRLYWRAREQ